MSNLVTVWVDFYNFDLFNKNLHFTAWSFQSNIYKIQIAIPKQRITRYENCGNAGVLFECY
jgi:hypothetical protein